MLAFLPMNMYSIKLKVLLYFSLIFLSSLVNYKIEAAEKIVLTIGAVHYPPYYDFSEEEPKGFLVEHLIKSLQHNYEIKWLRIPLARGGRSLKNKLIQVYGSYAPGPEDKADVEYAKNPLVKMQPIICSLRSITQNFDDTALKGQEVIYPQGAYVHSKVEDLKLKIQRLDYTGNYILRAIKMIKKERAKFFILPESFGVRPFLKSNPQLMCANFANPIAMHLSFAPRSPWRKTISPLHVLHTGRYCRSLWCTKKARNLKNQLFSLGTKSTNHRFKNHTL